MKNTSKLIITLGIISGIIFFVSGNQLIKTSNNMKELRSESGTSLAEYYYQEIGQMNKGLGILAYAFGLSVVTVSIGIGAKLNVVNRNNTISDTKTEKAEENLNSLGL